MPQDQDTGKTPETGQEVNGNQGDQPTTVSEDPKPVETKEDPRIAEMQAELNKARQRANQLENAQEKARQTALEEQGKWEEIARENQAKLDAVEAQKAEEERVSEAYKLRDQAIEEIADPKVKQLAKALVSQNKNNLMWTGELDAEEAKAEVKKQMEALAPIVGTTEDSTIVDANNPLPEGQSTDEPTDIEARIARIKENEKKLATYKF